MRYRYTDSGLREETKIPTYHFGYVVIRSTRKNLLKTATADKIDEFHIEKESCPQGAEFVSVFSGSQLSAGNLSRG